MLAARAVRGRHRLVRRDETRLNREVDEVSFFMCTVLRRKLLNVTLGCILGVDLLKEYYEIMHGMYRY